MADYLSGSTDLEPETMQDSFAKIIEAIGEDLQRDGLRDTPQRAAKAFQFLTRGYQQELDDVVNGALFDSDNHDMVLCKDIEFYSMCEHHLLPFTGKCHIAYIPNGKVLGLSKMARIVDMFARRLQIQESFTKQIGNAIEQATGCAGVAVVVEASHMCMMMRGVEKQNASMKTRFFSGDFKDDAAVRAEFLAMV